MCFFAQVHVGSSTWKSHVLVLPCVYLLNYLWAHVLGSRMYLCCHVFLCSSTCGLMYLEVSCTCVAMRFLIVHDSRILALSVFGIVHDSRILDFSVFGIVHDSRIVAFSVFGIVHDSRILAFPVFGIVHDSRILAFSVFGIVHDSRILAFSVFGIFRDCPLRIIIQISFMLIKNFTKFGCQVLRALAALKLLPDSCSPCVCMFTKVLMSSSTCAPKALCLHVHTSIHVFK